MSNEPASPSVPPENTPGSDKSSPPAYPLKRIVILAAIILCLSVLGVAAIDNSTYLAAVCQQQTFSPYSGTEDMQKGKGYQANYPLFAFDLRRMSIPRNQVRAGGVQKDEIPALVDTETETAEQSTHLNPRDRVVGVVLDGEARAYPIKIMRHHEIANDQLGGMDIAVTYCPLCDSVAVYDRNTEGGTVELRVSGLVYQNNVLMFDRSQSEEDLESLWLQIGSKSVSGESKGEALDALPVELTTWGEWKQRYPDTAVLIADQGFSKDYENNPYAQYESSLAPMFEIANPDKRLPHKERVLGVWTEKTNRAYPVSLFSADKTTIEDEIGGLKIKLAYNPNTESIRVVEADEGLEWMYSFWFAWAAIRRDTEIHNEDEVAAKLSLPNIGTPE
ncbi:hypothetical protein Pla110_03980 [Polystyrenella longa]|uniref:DUF3179 domain-containing protein n=1 Tax=Polystyrenella longa TaxID=2528007 RepID=A0A518CHP7_9PLAN|nr:DUF3179 domain-containing protein [Polystyrenella longa]QDU78694.1 hypothetical protein Pla110_03980 [Polystyrenella longa]